MSDALEFKSDTLPDLSRDEAARLINGGAEAEIAEAFADGVLIGYEKRVLPNRQGDLEIKLVLRHKSKLPKARDA